MLTINVPALVIPSLIYFKEMALEENSTNFIMLTLFSAFYALR